MTAYNNTPANAKSTRGEDLDHIEQLLRLKRAAPDRDKRLRICRQLDKAQDAELHRFARALDLRPLYFAGSVRNWTIAVLGDVRPAWCELCGNPCKRTEAGHGQGFIYNEGFSKVGEGRLLRAVLIHSVWPFELIERYVRSVGLTARLVGWSWNGPEFTAALVTRSDI